MPLLDRLRLGLRRSTCAARTTGTRYESITAEEWIKRYMGKGAYEAVWGPLLRGKFGDADDQLAMVWLWSKIHLRFASRKGVPQKEQLGYLLGSFGAYIDELERRLRAERRWQTSIPAARSQGIVDRGWPRARAAARRRRALPSPTR